MDKTLSIIRYKEAGALIRKDDKERAFEKYVDSFLSRMTDVEYTLEFVAFYRYQLKTYLNAKPVFVLSLPEGDMISDLIKDGYDSFLDAIEASPFNITGEGRMNLLESVKIVFPWQNDTDDGKDIL